MADTVMQEQVQAPRTAVTTLRVLAQTPGDWTAWAEQLSSALKAVQGAAGRTASRSWQVELAPLPGTAGEAAGSGTSGRARWIVLVDSPARYLAALLEAGPQVSAPEALSAWQTNATQALSVIHSLRSHCAVFDSEEAASHPAAVSAWLSGWLGEELPEDTWPVRTSGSGLLAKLAADFAQTDRRATALWSEMLACCSPLPGIAIEPAVANGSLLISADQLAQAQAWAGAAARLPALEAAQQSLRAQLEVAQRQLAELQSLKDEELQGARSQAQEARSEAELLLMQLHQVQEELEALFLRQEDSAKVLASTQAELKSAQDGLTAMQQRLQAEQQRAALQEGKRHDQAASDQAEASRKLIEADFQQKKAALEAEAKEARQEAELLLVQLHYVQEELEAHFLALQSARLEQEAARETTKAAQGQPEGWGFPALARQHEVVAARLERPYRELDLRFGDVTLGADKLASMAVRLVEHEGRAGLALVALPGLPPPISQWASDGEDGRGAYMLFIPGDAKGRERLAALGTRNWRTLLSVAVLVQRAAADAATPEAALWQGVAARLCITLQSLPARLRYDAMTAEQVGQSIAVHLDGVCFGTRLLPPVALHWSPDSRQSTLKLLRTDERVPCLAAWPAGPDGALVSELVLPVAHEHSLGSRLRWWTQLLPADRDLALALVDTLAAVPALLPEGGNGIQRQQLVAKAVQLRLQLQRNLNLGRWARRLRQGLRGQRT